MEEYGSDPESEGSICSYYSALHEPIKRSQLTLLISDAEVESSSDDDEYCDALSGMSSELVSDGEFDFPFASRKEAEMRLKTEGKSGIEKVVGYKSIDYTTYLDEEPKFFSIQPTKEEIAKSLETFALANFCATSGFEVAAAELWLQAYKMNPGIIDCFFDLEYWTPFVLKTMKGLSAQEMIASLGILLACKQESFDGMLIYHMIAKLRLGFQLFKQGLKHTPSIVDIYSTGFVEGMWIQESKHCLPTFCLPHKVIAEGYRKVANKRKGVEWRKFNALMENIAERKRQLREKMQKRHEKKLDIPLSGKRLLYLKRKKAKKYGTTPKLSFPVLPIYRKIEWGGVKPLYFTESMLELARTCKIPRYSQYSLSFMQLFTELHPKADPEVPASKLGLLHKYEIARKLSEKSEKYQDVRCQIDLFKKIPMDKSKDYLAEMESKLAELATYLEDDLLSRAGNIIGPAEL